MTPRHDFNSVSKFKPFAFALRTPQSELESTFQNFDKQCAFLAFALDALAQSLGRYDSVSALREKYQSTKHVSSALIKSRALAETNQADAIAHNAAACAGFVDSLVLSAPKVNSAWLELKQKFNAGGNAGVSLTPQELSSKFATQWRADMPEFQESFRLNNLQVDQAIQQVNRMVLEQKFAAELPKTLLDANWHAAMQTLSPQLRQLSVTYADLNKALRKGWSLPALDGAPPETLGYSLLASGVAVFDEEKALASPLNSGIRLATAFWVAKRDPAYGWWGVVPAGTPQPPDEKAWTTKSADAFLVPPGEYDVYWKQDYEHDPMLLAGKVRVEANQVVEVKANAGIRLMTAPWVALPNTYGWWGAVPVGESADRKTHWSRSADVLLVVPGEYDVYWKQDFEHKPMLLAGKVKVKENQVAEVNAGSGIQLTVPRDTPLPDARFGWWGMVREGGKPEDPIQWSRGKFEQPLLLAPGTYDILWKQDFRQTPATIKRGAVVKENNLTQIDAQPPVVALPTQN